MTNQEFIDSLDPVIEVSQGNGSWKIVVRQFGEEIASLLPMAEPLELALEMAIAEVTDDYRSGPKMAQGLTILALQSYLSELQIMSNQRPIDRPEDMAARKLLHNTIRSGGNYLVIGEHQDRDFPDNCPFVISPDDDSFVKHALLVLTKAKNWTEGHAKVSGLIFFLQSLRDVLGGKEDEDE